MVKVLKKEKVEAESLKDKITKLMVEHGLMRKEAAEAIDSNYNRDEEVNKLVVDQTNYAGYNFFNFTLAF